MITKDQLTERKRGKGGTLVRPSAAFLAGQNERNALQARALGVEDRPMLLTDQFVVVDLMARKGYNRPGEIGIAKVGSGLAFGIPLHHVDIALSDHEERMLAEGDSQQADLAAERRNEQFFEDRGAGRPD